MHDETNPSRKYDHFSHVSFPDYFLQLLELQAVDWLRLPLFQGLATSSVAGAEGLIRSSRLALVQCIRSKDIAEQEQFILMIIKDLSTVLREILKDDRYAIPVMELVAFLIDGFVPSMPNDSESMYAFPPTPHPACTNPFTLASGNFLSSSKKRISNRLISSASKLQSKLMDRYQGSQPYDPRC